MTLPGGWSDDGNSTNSTTIKRRFSYFCLHWNDNLCLGVSPGGSNDATQGLYVQLKPYARNYYKGTESKKMRWDIIQADDLNGQGQVINSSTLDQGYLRLEAEFPTLCVDRLDTSSSNILLYPCTRTPLSSWLWDGANGVLRLGDDPTLCATVTVCVQRNDPARSCMANVETVEINPKNFKEGSVVHAMKCYDQGGNAATYEAAQTFTRELDCVAGCSPDMLDNGQCDQICNNPACAEDKGECVPSTSPTATPSSPPVWTDSPTEPTSNGNDVQGDIPSPLGDGDVASHWWLIFLLLLFGCLGMAAFLLRRRRKRRAYARAFEPDGNLDGGSENLVNMSGSVLDDDLDDDETRFKTASAVALNQLRYHSRVAHSSSSNTTHVSHEAVKRKADSSASDKSFNFQEVGLV